MTRRPTIILDVVGLTPGLVTDQTPHLEALARQGFQAALECPFPALTLSSQASMLTGKSPEHHGIVGNGWYFRELAEPLLWRQPHALLQTEDVPTRLRRERPGFTVAKLFWWFNMYAPVDWAVTPRPMYPADGRKVPDIHTDPGNLREELQDRFGPFPLFRFWGPAADLVCSRWITDASKHLITQEEPDLSLVYIPHLDYDFQRYGPSDERSRKALGEVDQLVGEFHELATRLGHHLLVVSEYGITDVQRPIHPNRILREAGLLSIRMEEGLERLDYGASRAFAIADHQIAHVVINDPGVRDQVIDLFENTASIESVLRDASRAAAGLHHERAGDLVLVSTRDSWFTYYFWLDDALAPDYARTVDIHRKPGYDPVELFIDPQLKAPKLKLARRLLGKKLGFRNLMDLIGLDATLVGGSHGRRADSSAEGPILICSEPRLSTPTEELYPLAKLPQLIADLTPDRSA